MSSSSGYYGRTVPYGYFEQPDNSARVGFAVSIHEPETEPLGSQIRRRIAVACTRCRRRKIKCSGDSGDGHGCQACKHSGAEASNTCNFVRVQSHPMIWSDIGNYQPEPIVSRSDTPFPTDAGSPSYAFRKPSLPMLYTRSSCPWEFEQQYDSSVVDGMNLPSSLTSQSSVTSTAGFENYRAHASNAALLGRSPGALWGQLPSSTFGNLYVPSHNYQSTVRLPSVTTEASSLWNMKSLHSSLPAQERRLPVPHFPQTQSAQHNPIEIPRVRELVGEPRAHINGIHSRSALPWSVDANYRASSPTDSPSPTQQGLPTCSETTLSTTGDSTFGYSFVLPTTNARADCSVQAAGSSSSHLYSHASPPSSIKNGSSLSKQSLSSSPSFRYLIRPSQHHVNASQASPCHRHSSLSTQSVAPALYSFSTDNETDGGRSHTTADRDKECTVPLLQHSSGLRPPQTRPHHVHDAQYLTHQSPDRNSLEGGSQAHHRTSTAGLTGRL